MKCKNFLFIKSLAGRNEKDESSEEITASIKTLKEEQAARQAVLEKERERAIFAYRQMKLQKYGNKNST